MRMTLDQAPGRGLFAFGMAGLGVLSLIFHKFALQWQPVPAWVPEPTAYVSGAILLLAGIGLLFKRTAAVCALVLLVDLAIWVVVLHVPNLVLHPLDIGGNLPICEDLALMCGAWLTYAAVNDGGIAFLGSRAGLVTVRVLFGVTCLVFGLSHFVYADFTSQMVPSFLPFRLPLAYITGAGHFAAGLALISGVLPRLAATCEAIMMSLFVVLVHIPMVLAGAPPETTQLYWTMLFVACALSGSAWNLTSSLKDRPWLALWKA